MKTAIPLVLGLDPSPLRLGYALCTWGSGEPKWCGTLDINQVDAGWRPHQYARAMGRINYSLVFNHPEYALHAISVEEMFMGPSPKMSLELADVAGITSGLCASMYPDLPVYRFTPSEWRKACGLKGNATKEECYEHAKLVGYDPPPITKKKDPLGGKDAADAGLIALAAYRRHSPATLVREQEVAA